MTLAAVQLDHLSLGTILIFGGILLLWIGLGAILGPLIGRWIKGDFTDEHPDRERVGLLDEPTDFELHRLDRNAKRRRGVAAAKRSRDRRVEATTFERDRGRREA